jgi:hypothetical protein
MDTTRDHAAEAAVPLKTWIVVGGALPSAQLALELRAAFALDRLGDSKATRRFAD